MTAVAAEWERHPDGSHISIPIRPRDLPDVRAWCAEHCGGDHMVVLGRQVVFERREDASLATLFWRADGA